MTSNSRPAIEPAAFQAAFGSPDCPRKTLHDVTSQKQTLTSQRTGFASSFETYHTDIIILAALNTIHPDQF
jgi:hypothetical protein